MGYDWTTLVTQILTTKTFRFFFKKYSGENRCKSILLDLDPVFSGRADPVDARRPDSQPSSAVNDETGFQVQTVRTAVSSAVLHWNPRPVRASLSTPTRLKKGRLSLEFV